ncbi:MAG TPA: hypothetical protein PKI46_09045, partial [Bacteroidales bacterium]|nr:hypothetical protein [Bacteroidales bacterium]
IPSYNINTNGMDAGIYADVKAVEGSLGKMMSPTATEMTVAEGKFKQTGLTKNAETFSAYGR